MLSQESVIGTWRFAPYIIMTHGIMRYGASVEVAKVFTETKFGQNLPVDEADVQTSLDDAYRGLLRAKEAIEAHYKVVVELNVVNGVPTIKSIERPDNHIDKE